MLVAFGGLVLAFADGFFTSRGTLLGDAFGLIAGLFWAATTVLIRATKLSAISAGKTLFYQLGVSAVLLAAKSSTPVTARGSSGLRLAPRRRSPAWIM